MAENLHYSLNQKRILLADDNPINREMVKKILENNNFRVTTASDGEETLEYLFQNNNFDLILLDINMPKLSGLEVARIIRKTFDKKVNMIPIAALTGNDTESEINEIFNSGINSYIAKPATPSKLMEIIHKTIKKENSISPESSPENSHSNLENHFNHIGQDEIDIKKGTYFLGNDPVIFKKLLHRFHSNYKDYMKKIIELIKAKNHQEALFVIHNLKGTSAQICAFRLHKNVENFEKKIKKNLDEVTDYDLDYLNDSFNSVLNAIAKILEINHQETEKRVESLGNSIHLNYKEEETLQKIIEALKMGKPKRVEQLLLHLHNFKWEDSDVHLIEDLKLFTHRYDFKNAISKAETLLKKDN